ncbi:hypothetical protein [Phytohabitans houttuyneae]|uniref:ATP/GTP-binding protein n=1 Tax=Phytohabitans houttuyneae TaxID=1076126 RepID=A0A6V8KI57_9ACTN|nr:hypothetical protein [Phytohabitans houttuyneae]GFJ84882.1 ATP/GTP-binding protein [Phytohabitans houttuyneae]
MLRAIRYTAAILILGGLGLVSPTAAHADGFGHATCAQNPHKPGCEVTAGTTGGDGSTRGGKGGRGGEGKCRNPSGQVIPCQRDGALAGGDGCYYKPADLSAGTIAALGGQPGGEGGWYQRTCYGTDGTATVGLGGPVWIAGAPPVVSPEVLARQARARLDLPNVVIELNPPGDQLVNLPIWLALDRSSWSERSATASVPGVSVTATARPVKATWSMGDGGSVVCHGPGTVWRPGTDPAASSPDCGYAYRRSSVGTPGNRFTVTVTIAWEVTWAGAGQSGTIPGLTTTGSIRVPVQESQAVIS